MESIRQQKVARLVQKELGGIFQNELRSLFAGSMITVTKVRITPDLAMAKVYLSIFGSGEPKEVIEDVRNHAGDIRRRFGNYTHNQLRHIPEFQFYIDDSLDYVDEIESLLKK